MGWKDWSYVKKGAVIGFTAFAIKVLFFFISPLIGFEGLMKYAGFLFVDIYLVTFFAFGPDNPGFPSTNTIVAVIIMSALLAIVYVGIGILIGKLVEKIKLKKSF